MTNMPAQSAPEMFIRCPVSPVTRLIVGVDGSAGSAAAVRWAAAEACRREVVLRIVSAWEGFDEPASCIPHPAQIAAARVQKALAHVLDQQVYPRHVACVTVRGAPGEALLNDIDATDLLVLGACGVGVAGTPGPVGQYCLQRWRGPLVFVPARIVP